MHPLGGHGFQTSAIRSLPHDHQLRAGYLLPDLRQGTDQLVLALPAHKARSTHHQRRIPNAQNLSSFGTFFGACRAEILCIYPRRQRHVARLITKHRPQTPIGIGGNVRDDVSVAPDGFQRLAGAWQHRPAHLMPMRSGDDALRTRLLRCLAHQPKRGCSAEPDGVNVVLTNQLLHAALRRRRRQHHPSRPTDYLKGLHCVERLGAFIAFRRGGKHHDLLSTTARDVLIDVITQVGLNPANSGREIIGDKQHRHSD